MITGIHVAFQTGNVLSFVRIAVANALDKAVGKKWSRYIQKPLWDCLPCMASVWVLVLSQHVDLGVTLAVCGLNAVIERLITHDAVVD